eukprot:CAMPEP_0173332078 /NCGR_PEP_ID=MMETSP1144-20121109/4163_1 /TAXON_ID=483371 /ORGANISM="non described non described, Strain CCMP2298" /LENGTH=448 /DNA_ID=CAMNT_0014276943 /DNA_START=93 /DNA_END=1436 /DNA_ORIENTATION=+
MSHMPFTFAGSPTEKEDNAGAEDRVVYGLDLKVLKQWQRERREKISDTEESRQEQAVAQVRGFLDAVGCAVKLQAWWRMRVPKYAYELKKNHQKEVKTLFFRAFWQYFQSERMFKIQKYGKYYHAWREEARTEIMLRGLVTQFFKICIQRLRLTPQACMAFFNPGEWRESIERDDLLKIRRLVLEKLFGGWRAETRELRRTRYMASQILSRMVRRTKGPLWIKEATLVCFHMWHRYGCLSRAFKNDTPAPRFTNPMLPQWMALVQSLTVRRIKKKRCADLGYHLSSLRTFQRWKYLMTVDRSKPVTPLAVAIMHHSRTLKLKMILLWHAVLRERGGMMRFRDRIFYNWRRWAPKNKIFREFTSQARELLRLKKMESAFGVMIKLCFNVIGARTEKIKELRRNFCDRKVVLCAYALLHKDSHVMMVDCWRRLTHFWRSRINWKTMMWRY